MNRASLLLIAIAAAGCNLYTHNSGDDVVCNGGGTAGVAEYDSRDPETGICTYSTGGGGGECDNGDGCCADPVSEPIEAVGSTCDGACEGLAENDCLAAAGCHADYEAQLTELGALPNVFAQCWDIQPLPTLEGGDCTQFDAYTCAQHDDCISIMDGIAGEDGSTYGYFQSCASEIPILPPNLCDGVDCGSGASCEVDCTPESCPAGSGSDNGCMDSCYATCVANESACSTLTTESACDARSDCESVYDGSGCTCDDSGCTCQTETWATCEDNGGVVNPGGPVHPAFVVRIHH